MGKRNKRTEVSNSQALFAILVTLIISFSAFILETINTNFTLSQPVYAMAYEEIEVATLPVVESKEPQNIETFDIMKKIDENIKPIKKEEISQTEEDLEYTTVYKLNSNLPKGSMQVLQEGRDGKQQIITKRYYEGDVLVNEKVDTKIIIAAVDKIVEIGSANYTSSYKAKIGDTVFVTSNTLAVRVEANKNAEKIITINKNDKVKIIDIQDSWYKIRYNSYEGYVPNDCVTYIDPNAKTFDYEKSKAELMAGLSKNMNLNKPSELSLNQFKKVLSGNSQDKNKIFENNAEYFYYIEKQYNINGLFVAAVGIHESNWGSSKIANDKRNLFGYGASDSNPYNNAKTFSTYAEGIDLVARVFVKYYVNAPGTAIFDGQTASGKYYSGSTLSAVNKRYASDKNWNEGVYKWMSYLYNRT